MIASNVILTPDRLADTVQYFLNEPEGVLSFDMETSGDNRGVPYCNSASWIGLAARGRTAVIPFGHPIGSKIISWTKEPRQQSNGIKMFRVPVYERPPEQLTEVEVFEALEPLFFDSGKVLIGHGMQFDLATIAKYYGGRIPTGPYCDTIILRWLLDENRKRYGLKYITKDIYGFTYDDEEVGKKVEAYPFNKVAQYLYDDVLFPLFEYRRLRPLIDEQGLEKVFQLEMDLLPVLARMRLTGMKVDRERLEEMRADLGPRVEEVEGEIYRAAGRKFNVNGWQQKQDILFLPKSQGGQGLKPWKLSKGGKERQRKDRSYKPVLRDWSTDSDVLETLAGNPVVDALLDYQEWSKLLNTYVIGYLGDDTVKDKPCRIFDDRIFADFVQYGTKTGRFSCVSGDTELVTNRGIFRFDEYQPMVGDLVPTHEGRWQPVLRKVYKGRSQMFRVALYNGAEIKATGEHRFYTSSGWKYLRDLRPEDKVYSYVGFQDVHGRPGEHPQGVSPLPGQPAQANHYRGRGVARDDVPQRPYDHRPEHARRQAEGREGTPLFSIEDVEAEPDARKEWFPASRLPGGDTGRARVPTAQGRRPVRAAAPARDGSAARAEAPAIMAGRASHRRDQAQLRAGQPGGCYEGWSREAARQEVAIREITPLGTMGVWDIEVDGDHSYATQGFLNHNCREPNLQNVGRPGTELGTLIRGAFLADTGRKLIVADYDQIELVVLAHFLGQGAMFDGFMNGIDPHTMTAALVLGKRPEDITKAERQKYGKSINFAVVYGAGDGKVASMIGCSVREAKEFLAKHEVMFPEIYAFRDYVIEDCRSKGYITTLFGRRRNLPGIHSRDNGMRMYSERQAFNSLIQGSSADIMKFAMVRLVADMPDWMQLHLTVHDELVTSAEIDRCDEGQKILLNAMTGPGIGDLLRVPLSSDCAIVDRWSDAK